MILTFLISDNITPKTKEPGAQLIAKLKDILATQMRLMGELLALLERETSELLAVNLNAISEINDLKESMIHQKEG